MTDSPREIGAVHEGYQGYDAARSGTAVAGLVARGWIHVGGSDAVSFLHGVLTNDVAALVPGRACYAAYLTPQGRMLTDMRVLRRELDLVLETEPEGHEMLAGRLDGSIFMEDVRIENHSTGTASVTVAGPGARQRLAAWADLGVSARVGALDLHEHLTVPRGEHVIVLLGSERLGVPAVDAIGPLAACEALEHDLLAAGAERLGRAAAEALRIEAGIPLFGRDMTPETIPLEAGIEHRAISMTKGCYVGQEMIVRVLHRGHGRVARRLLGLLFEGTAPPGHDAVLKSDGKEVGRVTSAAFSPGVGRAIGLGYVHRDFSEPGTRVRVEPDGLGATVTAVPFRRRQG